MNILFISHKPPIPAIDGGCLAMKSTLELMKSLGYDIHLFSFFTEKHPKPLEKLKDPALKQEYHYLDVKVKAPQAIKHLIAGKNYNLSRFRQKSVSTQLIKTLSGRNYDIIHVESLFSMVYYDIIKKYSTAPIVYRSHNIETKIWRDLAAQTQDPIKRFYLNKLTNTLDLEELKLSAYADHILCISALDQEEYNSWGFYNNSLLLPSFDVMSTINEKASGFYHLGAMDWQPNLEGVNWLLKEVQQRIKSSNLSIHLAGKAMSKSLLNSKLDNIIIDGEVPDAKSYIMEKAVCLVPLFSGSGVRMKVLEALALGKAIISTSKGIEGLSLLNNEQVLIANTPKAFADAIQFLNVNPEETNRLANNGLKWARENLSRESQKATLDLLYNKLIYP